MHVNPLRPEQKGWHFVNGILKFIFFNIKVLVKISVKFVPKEAIDNMWSGSGDGLAPNSHHAMNWIIDDQDAEECR